MSTTKISRYSIDCYYNTRGCLSFIDRKSSIHEFFDESFVCELIKQISPKIVKTIGTKIQTMKRRHMCIDFVGDAVLYEKEWYVDLLLYGPCVGPCGKHSRIWIKCSTSSNFDINPWAYCEPADLNFEIIYDVPIDVVKRRYEYILINASKAKTQLDKERYIDNYKTLTKSTRFDEWVKYFQVEFCTDD